MPSFSCARFLSSGITPESASRYHTFRQLWSAHTSCFAECLRCGLVGCLPVISFGFRVWSLQTMSLSLSSRLLVAEKTEGQNASENLRGEILIFWKMKEFSEEEKNCVGWESLFIWSAFPAESAESDASLNCIFFLKYTHPQPLFMPPIWGGKPSHFP